jgi:RNA polymerase sigma factor (TIGR02999 family)
MSDSASITQMVNNLKAGGADAFNALFPLVYEQLKKIAHREKQKLWNADTINATALVHEVYMKLIRSEELNAESRAHFFALCAVGMRQIIINYIEQKVAKKRGGDWQRVSLSDALVADEHDADTLLTIDKSLTVLSTFAPDLTSLVEMRFFAGMSESEIALVNGCTERTVRRNWSKAKALLHQILEDAHPSCETQPQK